MNINKSPLSRVNIPRFNGLFALIFFEFEGDKLSVYTSSTESLFNY
ncbi:hypothetical protein HMPREF0793_1535 [Staphylococcus caprae M23864:W1]|nr:hypothetical protein HMPREF0793_1535 [Staphylococcus caprae M23864:W1]